MTVKEFCPCGADQEFCPCGADQEFSSCCETIHLDHTRARTAEQLMRARYSAFAKGDVGFLRRSLEPSQQAEFDEDGARKWSETSMWLGLEILQCQDGGSEDTSGTVEFRAHFDSGQGEQVHHELSEFQKDQGLWYYSHGQAVAARSVGRNEPCPCGSGRKYKKCCMN